MTSNKDKLKKKYEKIPTSVLGIYQNKIMAYISDVSRNIQKLRILDAFPLEARIDYNIQEKGEYLSEKYNESQDLFNEIQLELERRISKDIRFDLDYGKLTKIQGDTEELIRAYQEKQNNQGSGPQNGSGLQIAD